MKATGIVRRIDDLGRVVIPKEIRRTLRIRDGDPLEIYTEKDGEVIFKKYSPVGELSDFATQICESLYKTADCTVVVCDRDSVIAAAGVPKKELRERHISDELSRIMEGRKLYAAEAGPVIPLSDGDELNYISVAATILSEGDIMGCVVFVARPGAPAPTELQVKLAETVAGFLGKQMEG